jgi:hypothetical protein
VIVSQPLRRLLRFRGLVWTASIAFALYMIFGPLFQNYWARHHWQQIPCYQDKDFAKTGYYYYALPRTTGPVQYVRATRTDFWARPGYVENSPRTDTDFREAVQKTCYLNPRNPKDPVLNLDTDDYLWHAWDRMTIAALVLAVAVGITWWKPRGKATRPPAAPQRRPS